MKLTTYLNHELIRSKRLASGDPKRSFATAEMVLELSSKHQLRLISGQALFHMAYACRVMSDYGKGLNYAFQSLDLLKSCEDVIGICRAQNIIGIIYFYFGAYDDAISYFLSALPLAQKASDANLETSILNNIGEIYREAKNDDKAFKYYEKALKIALENALMVNASAIHLNMGEVLFHSKQYDKSLTHLTRAYVIIKDMNRLLEQGEIETKLGRANVHAGQLSKARDYFLSALEKLKVVENKFYLVDLLVEMASLDVISGKSPMRNLNEALEIAIAQKFEKKVADIYLLISSYYESQRDYRMALDYYRNHHLKLNEVDASNLSKKLEILSIEIARSNDVSERHELNIINERLIKDVEVQKQALEQMREKHQELIKENQYDELTEVLNRRGLEKRSKQFFENQSRIKGVMMILDIDYFKRYNDTFGHVRGDWCLKTIAKGLGELFRDHLFGRYGGEEFIAFVRCETKEDAIDLMEHARMRVASMAIDRGLSDGTTVTISVGGTFGEFSADQIRQAVDMADKALYQAKDEGRDRVMLMPANLSS